VHLARTARAAQAGRRKDLARAAAWLSQQVDRVSMAAAAALAAAMTVALGLQVLFRFVVRSPLSWSEELARYCFVWLASLGAAAALRRGLHPALELGASSQSGRGRQWWQVAGELSVAVFLLVVAVYGWRLAAFNMRQVSPAMGLPMGVPYAAVPTGACVMLLHLLARWSAAGEDGGEP